MKHSMFVFAIAIATIALGCQNSNTTGPSATTELQARQLSKHPASDNVIQLNTTIRNGVRKEQEVYEVTGRVKFVLTQVPILRGDLFDLVLETDAKVSQLIPTQDSWTFGNTSIDRINLTLQTSATVDRWYFLRGGPNSLYLHIQFSVTTNSMSVISITIE